MLQGDLTQFICTTPFRPFRITMADGATYDVRFRQGFILTPMVMMIGLLPSADGTSYVRVAMLDLMSITAVEPLPIPLKPQGNGQSPS